METIERFLERLQPEADELGVYLKPPLPEDELNGTAERIRRELGLLVPKDYLRLLRVTNGIETQSGYLSPLQEIGEQNTVLWFVQAESDANRGHLKIRYEPLRAPRTSTYLLLGYDGNSAEQVFDLTTDEFRLLLLGDSVPLNRDRSLVGLLKHLIYGEPTESDGNES